MSEPSAEANHLQTKSLRERYSVTRKTVKSNVRRALNNRPELDRKSVQTGAFLAAEEGAIDPLTGFLRRDGFRTIAESTMAAVNNSAKKIGEKRVMLALSDTDDFGLVNKNKGEAVGDMVLQTAGRQVISTVRSTDTVGRWGGEEFVYLLPFLETENAGPEQPAERIRRNLAVNIPEDGVSVTASLGITEYIPGETFEDFFERADFAMRAAKLFGKNRSFVAEKSNGLTYLTDLKDHITYTYRKEDDIEYLTDEVNNINYFIGRDEHGKPILKLTI